MNAAGDINDGFGETEIVEQIRQRERLLQIQVSERSRDTSVRDDLLNEARITVWQVLQKRPEASRAYVNAATGRRIVEAKVRGTWTGMPSQRGGNVDPLRRSDLDSLDDPLLQVEASAADVLAGVELAYHRGQILDALNALPAQHREYVVLRFWGGWTNADIATRLGVSPNNMARTWEQAIRPQLQRALHDLAGVVS